jgi:hypothetical protein
MHTARHVPSTNSLRNIDFAESMVFPPELCCFIAWEIAPRSVELYEAVVAVNDV